MKQDQITITWEQFESDVRELVNKIPAQKFDKILAITRGGLIPAYYLARLLFISRIETLNVSSYKGQERKNIVVHSKTQGNTEGNWLIVDDLIDSGKTIELAKILFPGSMVATLYKKPHSPEPDFFVKELDKWIVFPWET